MENTVLLGTFIKRSHVSQRLLKSIVENFNANRIFIFSVEDETHKRLITFNVNKEDLDKKFSEFRKTNKNTLRLHRNKESNTFYTINSLNKLIDVQNGTKDETFKVNWNDYKNCCLLVDNQGQFVPLKTKLAKIIEY
jgi:mRNA-degrading endonuclease YafQ of YafQ-DinJ toxin-antitoxin module